MKTGTLLTTTMLFGWLAAAVTAHLDLCTGGRRVANAIATGHEVDAAQHERALGEALAAAARAGVSGWAVTPFLLQQMRERTGGATLKANRALLLSNARLAGELAVALQR